MAGPILGYGQTAANTFAQQQVGNNLAGETTRPTHVKEKQIQPQGTEAAGAEEGNANNNGQQFDAQQAAQEILASQNDYQRGAVINLLI